MADRPSDPESAARSDRGVLFDMDGVLVATEGLKEEAHRRALRAFGVAGDIEPAFYHSMMGKPQDEVERLYLVEAGLAGRVDVPEYHARFRETYADLLSTDLSLAPGARALVERLGGDGWRLALVSSSLRWMVEAVLEQTGLVGAFGAVVAAEDVEREKPHPEPYLLALEALGLEPGSAVVLEDTPTGVVAGRAAGLPVVAVRHAWNGPFDLSAAAAILPGLDDVPAALRALEEALGAG
ncbi:MAG TPA: HAD family phosphatase [Gemmatimonadota bacterium]|nr:HAD family phosphatase [Gemmatimonadota bacterium]